MASSFIQRTLDVQVLRIREGSHDTSLTNAPLRPGLTPLQVREVGGSGWGQEAVGGAGRRREGVGVPSGGEAVQYDTLLLCLEHIFVSLVVSKYWVN